MALTGKEKKFADAVLAGKSNKDAAIAAGYSAATASAAGSRLVKKKAIAEYLENCRKDTSGIVASPIASSTAAQEDGQPFDPRPKLELIAQGLLEVSPQEFKALMGLMPYCHGKKGEGGKKEEKQAAAEKVATSKFGLRAVK